MTLVLATVDSGSFEWTALSATEHGCNTSLLIAYEKHVQQSPEADPLHMLGLIEDGDVNYVRIEVGEALRDGSRVAAPL